jgi:hypothetical protein
MDSYLMMLYVSIEQEKAMKKLFSDNGWKYCKPGKILILLLKHVDVSLKIIDNKGSSNWVT